MLPHLVTPRTSSSDGPHTIVTCTGIREKYIVVVSSIAKIEDPLPVVEVVQLDVSCEGGRGEGGREEGREITQ